MNVKEMIKEMKEVESLEERKEVISKFKKDELIEICFELLGDKRKFQKGRKDEILEILQNGGSFGVEELGKMIGISGKNVSSQLTYLRKDGYLIGTRSNGKKYLENE